MQHGPIENGRSLRFEAELNQLASIRAFIEETAAELDCDPEAVLDMIQAVDEAITNTKVHGYQEQPGTIEVEVRRDGNDLVVRLQDQAPVFDPTQAPIPDLSLPLEERPLGGLGVFMILAFVDEVTHCTPPEGGNVLTLVKTGAIKDDQSH